VTSSFDQNPGGGYTPTPCLGGYCCYSSLCTTACDSQGNCLGSNNAVWPPPTGAAALSASTSPENVVYIQQGSNVAVGKYLCAQNYYGSPSSGCYACPTGATTVSTGATNIDQCNCPVNTFLDTTSGRIPSYTCTACLSGTSTAAGALNGCNSPTYSISQNTWYTYNALCAILAVLVFQMISAFGAAVLHRCGCCLPRVVATAAPAEHKTVDMVNPAHGSAYPQKSVAPISAGHKPSLPPGWSRGGPDETGAHWFIAPNGATQWDAPL
jgi:hypothetical protein